MKITSDGGELIGVFPASSSVVAGASALVSWFPGVGGQGGGGTGSVVSGFARKSGPQNYAAGQRNLAFSEFVSNDAAITGDGGPIVYFGIDLAHGGLVRTDVVMTWVSNSGSPYVGQLQLDIVVLDSTNAPVAELVGPNYYVSEMYSTDVGDTFHATGTGLVNCDDSTYVPPYFAAMNLENTDAIQITDWGMAVSILNPAGLT